MRDDKSEYMILKNRAYIGADDGTYEWAVKEIERLREALRKIRKATYESDPYYGGADLEVREIVNATLKKAGP